MLLLLSLFLESAFLAGCKYCEVLLHICYSEAIFPGILVGILAGICSLVDNRLLDRAGKVRGHIHRLRYDGDVVGKWVVVVYNRDRYRSNHVLSMRGELDNLANNHFWICIFLDKRASDSLDKFQFDDSHNVVVLHSSLDKCRLILFGDKWEVPHNLANNLSLMCIQLGNVPIHIYLRQDVGVVLDIVLVLESLLEYTMGDRSRKFHRIHI